MIKEDFIQKLKHYDEWFIRTACGWKITDIQIVDDIIYGNICIAIRNPKDGTRSLYKQSASWLRDGTPTDLKQYPTRYYTRLVHKWGVIK